MRPKNDFTHFLIDLQQYPTNLPDIKMSIYSNMIAEIEKNIKSCFQSEIQLRLGEAMKKISAKFNIPIEDLSSEFDFDDICFDVTRSMGLLEEKTNKNLEKKKKTSSKTKEVKKSRECAYINQRGSNKGQPCGTSIKGDSEYCYKHSKNAKNAKNAKNGSEKEQSEDEKNPNECGCQYIMSRGNSKGKACGGKIKEGDRCSKHTDKKIPKIKLHPLKDTPSKKKKESDSKEEKKTSNEVAENPGLVKRKPKFVHNKELDIYVHQPTNLVIKSATEHILIGRLHNGIVKQLEDADIEICKENDWQYNRDFLVSKEDEKEQEVAGEAEAEAEAEAEDEEEEEEEEEDEAEDEEREE